MYDSAAPVDALTSARAVLRLAEQRLGVRSQGEFIESVPAADQSLTAALLPEGVLPRGSVVSVLGSASLTAWLLGASQGDSWVAIVGWPALHAGALAEAGVELERVVVVPDVGGRAAEAIAALLAGIDVVVAGPRADVTAAQRRRLLARARERGTTLIVTSAWESSALVLRVDRAQWSGVDHGDGWLREVTLTVTRRARGGEERFYVVRGSEGDITVRSAGHSERRQPRLAAV